MIKLQRNLFEGDFPLTQYFGENPDWYAPFGMKGHNGIDYATPTGTVLYSCIDGRVTEVAYDANGYGKYIKIENDECGVIYAHMKTLSGLPVGSEVNAGDNLGVSGNTGNSTGPHLHFGVFPKPRDRSNGYAGYIDPFGNQIEWVDKYNGDPCSDLRDEVFKLEDELDAMRDSRNRHRSEKEQLQNKLEEERVEHMNAIKEKDKIIDQYNKQVAEMTSTVNEKNKMINTLKEDNKLLTDENRALQDQLNECQTTYETAVGSLNANIDVLNGKLDKAKFKIKQLELQINETLLRVSRWKLFISIFKKRIKTESR